jgi:hypothetical protein
MVRSGASMAITTPSTIGISTSGQLLVPAVTAEPLLTALKNLNHLWRYYRPPLVDLCPTGEAGWGRYPIVIPIIPSQDGGRYTFEHRVVPDSASTVTRTVETCTTYSAGATVWTTLYTTATAGCLAGAVQTFVDVDKVIAANVVAIRVSYSCTAGNPDCHHVLAYPSPADASTGIQAGSGFVPFDDGLLSGTTGAAVHTEWLNRCKLSTLKLLADRRQMCLSFAQKEGGTASYRRLGVSLDWGALPPVRIYFPNQGPQATIALRVIGTLDTGTTDGQIQVRQIGIPGGQIAQFGCDGLIQGADLVCTVQGSGLMAYCDVEIAAKSVVGNATTVRSVVGFWRPVEV